MRACGQNQRAAYAEMRKQHLAQLLIYELTVLIGGKCNVFKRKALHFSAVVIVALKRYERRPRGSHCMPQLLCHCVSRTGRAGKRIRKAAGAYDRCTAFDNSVARFNAGNSAILCEDMPCRRVNDAHACAVHVTLQSAGNVICVVRYGKNAVAPLRLEAQTKAFKPLHSVTRRQPVKGAVQESAVTGNIVQELFDVTVVCNIASALARYSQLSAEDFVRLEQYYVKAALGCHCAAQHSCGAAADDHCISTQPVHTHRAPTRSFQGAQRSRILFPYF